MSIATLRLEVIFHSGLNTFKEFGEQIMHWKVVHA